MCTALCMTALERICLKLLPCVFLLCWPVFATSDDSATTCKSSACLELQTERKVFADYAPDAQEDDKDDDADLMMHMQMKLNVDIPLDVQATLQHKAAELFTAELFTANEARKAQQEIPKAVKLSLAGAAATHHLQQSHSAGVAEGEITAAESPTAALSLLELSEQTSDEEPAVPAFSNEEVRAAEPTAFRTGNQLLFGACAGAVLVVLGALLATGLRHCLSGRKTLSDNELRARTKAWMLDWALGFEPEDIEDELSGKAEMKTLPRKKQPAMATASDSGDTDEDEPEAESDSGELLENAVFVAEQVEVANRQNEALDAGYGIPEPRLVDQICH